MPTADAYRRSSQGRVSTSTGPAIIAERAGQLIPIAPTRLASPEEDDAPAEMDVMVSRADGTTWFPDAFLDHIATNEDSILARDGSGLKLYDALLTDETAMSTLQQRRLAITSREYEVVPGDDKDPRSVKAADDFRAMIDGLGFDRVTGLLHYGVWYGYAVGEGMYEMRQHDGRLIVWLTDIVVPDRRHFGFTKRGELRFVGDVGGSISGEEVPLNKFCTLRTGGTHDFAFYGLGLAHWCYWPIFFKRAALKFWALYLEKRGNPTVAVEFTEADKDDQKKKANLLAAAVAVGKDSAVLLPDGTLKNERLKILESARNAPSGEFKDFHTTQDEAIMRVVLGQPGTSKGVSSGLNSNQAGEHADVKAEIVKADSDLITDAIQRTFGRWLTRWNHGEDVKPPLLRRILEDGEDLNTTAERDVKLDGIGIRRTEDSVKATYGDGYEVQREDMAEDDGTGDPASATGLGGKVQQQALNGAQITSLVELIQSVESGQIDKETAMQVLRVAFPTLGDPQIRALLANAGDDPEGYLNRLSLAKRGSAINDNSTTMDKDAARRAKVAEFAAQGGAGAVSPLYVSRKLLNGAELVAWAKSQGFKSTVAAAEMHVTICYSKTAVDWFAMGDTWASDADGGLTIRKGGPRFVEVFGHGSDDAAVVLRFYSDDLRWRHEGMRERGASSDYPDYKPHVTISYDGAQGVDLATVEPYTGELRFGPEIFEPIREKPAEDGFLAFTAADEEAIERLVRQLTAEADPVFEAMAGELRGALQGVTTVEAARVAILEAVERLPIDRLARLTALPMLAERAGASIGADELVG